MDLDIFLNNPVSAFSLGCYLGIISPGVDKRRQGLILLQRYGVIPDRETIKNCPECRAVLQTVGDRHRHGFRYICRNHAPVTRRFNPYQNTFLANVRMNRDMGEEKITMIIYSWLDRTPVTKAMETIQMSKETAIAWYGYCRDVACAIAWHEYQPIGGPTDIVEVDETHLFKRKYNVGRLTEWRHIWLLGGISRTTRDRFAVIVERRDAENMIPVLIKCIDLGSYICTDQWRAYNECTQIFGGHGTVNHSENFTNPPRNDPPHWAPPGRFSDECLERNNALPPPAPGMQPYRDHTNTVERSWRDLKEYLRTTNNVNTADQYIGEWMYRRNILDKIPNQKDKLTRFLRDIARVYPGIGKLPMRKRYEDIDDCDCHECLLD